MWWMTGMVFDMTVSESKPGSSPVARPNFQCFEPISTGWICIGQLERFFRPLTVCWNPKNSYPMSHRHTSYGHLQAIKLLVVVAHTRTYSLISVIDNFRLHTITSFWNVISRLARTPHGWCLKSTSLNIVRFMPYHSRTFFLNPVISFHQHTYSTLTIMFQVIDSSHRFNTPNSWWRIGSIHELLFPTFGGVWQEYIPSYLHWKFP